MVHAGVQHAPLLDILGDNLPFFQTAGQGHDSDISSHPGATPRALADTDGRFLAEISGIY